MGQQHNELRRGPLSNALANALGDTRGGGLERYGETLTPTVDLWALPEWSFLRDEALWAAQGQVAAVVGEFGFVAVRNPAGSRQLVIVEHGHIGQFGAGTEGMLTVLAENAIDVDAVNGAVGRDTRRVTPAGLLSLGTTLIGIPQGTGAAIQGERMFLEDAGVGSSTQQFPKVVLSPGFELRYYNNTVNQATSVGFWGRLRLPAAGEL